MRRFRLGDEGAFASIVARYHRKMYAVALGHLRDREDAEEIAQDTFIRAHRAIAGFRGESSLATWLYRITFNLSRNRYRNNIRRRSRSTVSLDHKLSEESRDTLADMIASSGPCPAREAAAGEFAETVARCIQRLSSGQREILRLRNALSQSYVEIGRRLGIDLGTVKSRIGRARESLRALVAESYPEVTPGAQGTHSFGPVRAFGLLAVACTP